MTAKSKTKIDLHKNEKGCLGNETAPNHFMACDFLYFFILTVTFACKGAVGAVAAAGALAGFLIFDQTSCRKEYCNSNQCYYQDVDPVCGKPVDHKYSPLLCFLCRSYKEVHKSCKNEQSEYQSDYVYGTCEEETELIYDECDSVSKYACTKIAA